MTLSLPAPLRRRSGLLLGFSAAALLALLAQAGAFAQEASPSAAPTSPAGSPTGAAGSLTVYSGRSESLVGPLLERFEAETGIDVEVRYGDSAELAALLLEEGDRSPADLFFSQDAGALVAVAASGALAPLDPAVLDRVDARFRDPEGHWVGTSGRARVAAYSTEQPDLVLPDSIHGFTDPAWQGRLGWAPTNGSFQAFVTALRLLEGEEAARAWLEGILANAPVAYDGNAAAVEGVAAGEVDAALVNHYYALELAAEHGGDFPVANHYFAAGDTGSLVNVAGVGQLATSAQPDAAAALVDFLLGAEAQAYFADTTFEYPLIDGVTPDPRLPALASIEAPDLDLSDLADLQGTVALLRDVGAID
jgi:iron(III) transport system substrate-binding protein